MTIDTYTCEIWLAMNEAGNYEVGTSDEEANERCVEQNGGLQIRLVRLNATMAPPRVTEVDVTVPDEAGQTVKAEVA